MKKIKEKKIKKDKNNDYEELEELFDKIEKMKEWKEWFGAPCKEFAPLCANCNFWNKWERFKQDIFQEMFNG